MAAREPGFNLARESRGGRRVLRAHPRQRQGRLLLLPLPSDGGCVLLKRLHAKSLHVELSLITLRQPPPFRVTSLRRDGYTSPAWEIRDRGNEGGGVTSAALTGGPGRSGVAHQQVCDGSPERERKRSSMLNITSPPVPAKPAVSMETSHLMTDYKDQPGRARALRRGS